MINYSLSYRNVKVNDLDDGGNKQYDSAGNLLKKTVQKAYAKAQSIDLLKTQDFCKAIAASGAYSTADILSIVAVLGKKIEQQVRMGIRVYCSFLGNFYPCVSSKGVENMKDFSPSAHIRKAYIGWVRPAEMKQLSGVTYNNVPTKDMSAALREANREALTSATLDQNDTTRNVAQTLDLIRTTYLLTVGVAEGMQSKGSTDGSGTYRHGTLVSIRAIPADGYAFTKWSDGCRDATRTVTVTAARTLNASFADEPNVSGTELCNEDGSALSAGNSVESIRLNFTGTPPQSGALTLVKVGADGTETTVSDADYSPCESGYGCFDFSAPYLMQAGTYRVLKNDVVILEWRLA